MKLKTTFLMMAVAGSAFLSLSATAQIPVTDGASIAARALETAQVIAKWVEQARQMQLQLSQMKQQYKALTGVRGMGDLLNNDLVRQQIPSDFVDTYKNLSQLGSAGVSAGARSIYSQIKKYGCDEQFSDEVLIRDCEAKTLLTPANIDFVNNALQSAQNRVNELKKLIGKVNQANDLKAAADLQNRIQAEQTLLQNETTMMMLAMKQQELQRDLLMQAQREANHKKIMTNSVNPFNTVQ